MFLNQTRSRSVTGLSLLLVGVLALAFGLARTSNAQESAFDIPLYGGNEVPPVETDATGTVSVQYTGDALEFTLNAEGATFTQAHIHVGAQGENGDVVAFLFQDDDGTSAVDVSGTITEGDLVGPLEGDWDAFVEAFATGNTYVNVHSESNPGGEIRAQLLPVWGTNLSAENETADVESDATGFFSLRAGPVGATWLLEASGGTEMFTMAHIHLGAAGVDGPIVVGLFDSSDEPVESISTDGMIDADDIIGDLEGDYDALIQALLDAELYVNVHSVEYPAGEIRGQLTHTSNVEDEPEEPQPTETPTDEPTATPTEEPDETPTPEPTATPTEQPQPTATPTDVAPTATPTREAPAAPDTGSGVAGTDGGGANMFVIVAGMAALAAGTGTLLTARRRNHG